MTLLGEHDVQNIMLEILSQGSKIVALELGPLQRGRVLKGSIPADWSAQMFDPGSALVRNDHLTLNLKLIHSGSLIVKMLKSVLYSVKTKPKNALLNFCAAFHIYETPGLELKEASRETADK